MGVRVTNLFLRHRSITRALIFQEAVWTIVDAIATNRRHGIQVSNSGLGLIQVFGCNQIAAATSACINGMGFGQFLSYQVMPLVDAGKLEIVLPDSEPEQLPVNLVYPGTRLVSARLRALTDWLRKELDI